MILTTHLLTGALIGAKIRNPFYVAILSVAVHFAMDMLPHGDYLNKKSKLKEFRKVAVDLFIGLSAVVSVIFFRNYASNIGLNITNISIGVFFSLLPDGTTLLYIMGVKFLKPIKKFHERLHYYEEFSPESEFRLKNNLWDIVISASSLILLFLL